MAINKVLKVTTDSELLSYIINATPELASEIDLPVQGQSIIPIGKIILSNERYKNAFLNTVNLIGLTVIKRNYWENPWEAFTDKGMLQFGQSVRELIVDLANVYDYNELSKAENITHFLSNEVPNVYNYIHELNYQKVYKTTTSDEQMAMAFASEGGLFDMIEKIVGSLYEGYKYDKYIVDKYMLCRRLVDGTISVSQIADYATLTPRERVAKLKNVSNLMTFRSPNYNPAGVRKATAFADQIAIINTDFEASLSTEVLATSFFRNDAEMKSQSALVDGFANHDTTRLTEVLGSAYTAFTADELTALAKVPAIIVGRDFFMDYKYAMDTNSGMKQTEFYNPETLKRNHYLHIWAVISTSPFENACAFTPDTPAVTSITVNPSESTVSAGGQVQLSATVATTGFANKAVTYEVEEAPGETTGKVTVDQKGLVIIPSDYTPTSTEEPNPIVIKVTSVFDSTKSETATITVL